MSQHTEAFVRQLTDQIPGLVPILREHIADFGEVLPHVFFGDLTRWVLTMLERRGSGDLSAAREPQRLLDLLEQAYASGDEELQELISVSFLEHLPRPEESLAEIRELLGPSLAAQLKVIG